MVFQRYQQPRITLGNTLDESSTLSTNMTDLFPLTSSKRLSLRRYGGAVNADIGYSGLQQIDRSPEKKHDSVPPVALWHVQIGVLGVDSEQRSTKLIGAAICYQPSRQPPQCSNLSCLCPTELHTNGLVRPYSSYLQLWFRRCMRGWEM